MSREIINRVFDVLGRGRTRRMKNEVSVNQIGDGYMRSKVSRVFRASAIAAAVALAWAPSSDARVTKIIIDRTVQDCVAFNNAGVCTTTDTNYESITGRAFGELDPMDEH